MLIPALVHLHPLRVGNNTGDVYGPPLPAFGSSPDSGNGTHRLVKASWELPGTGDTPPSPFVGLRWELGMKNKIKFDSVSATQLEAPNY